MRSRFSRVFGRAVATLILVAAAGGSQALDLVEVVQRAEKSVVRIDTDAGLGSGVIAVDGGWVLTNFHVIEGAKRVSIVLRSGKTLPSDGYLAIDPSHDLAILKTGELESGSAMKIAAELPKIGEKVAAFGCPQGLSFTTSEGIVSAVRTGRELVGILGERGYRKATDATWIQTTAPISPGNSGGPLVNMNAQLVGLNTMSYVDGQNLNFAISLLDIRRLLRESSKIKVPISFDDMPLTRAVPIAPSPDAQRDEFKLALPTGRVFSFEVFGMNVRAFNEAAASKPKDAVIIYHPNGSLFAAASQQDGKLHGATIAQWDNEQPMVYATYLDGKRHGVVKTWNEAGEPVFFGQYTRNRRNGFFCYFDDGEFRLLTQYKNDLLQWVQLMADEKALEGFPGKVEAEKNSEARGLLEKQEQFETALKTNEVTFRKSVLDFEKARRAELAKDLGVVKRTRARERRQQREAQDAAVHNALWRRFFNQ